MISLHVKSEDYASGYRAALQHIFDELTEMHHDENGYSRLTIDAAWSRVKKLEMGIRETEPIR